MLKIFEVRSEYFEAMVAFNPPKKIILPADASPSALVAQLSIMSSLDGSSSILKQTQKKIRVGRFRLPVCPSNFVGLTAL